MSFYFTNKQAEGKKKKTFSCKLEKERCEGRNKSGTQCRRQVAVGLPYCHTHIKTDLRLQIKKSRVAGAGKGLFAWGPHGALVFKTGATVVAEYRGEVVSTEELTSRYGFKTAPYAIQLTDSTIIDSACKRGIAAIANHKPRSRANAILSGTGRIRASRNIYAGDEIYVSYGANYRLHEAGVSHRTSK